MESEGHKLSSAFQALDVSVALAEERGKLGIMRHVDDGLATISLIAILTQSPPALRHSDEFISFPVTEETNIADRLLLIKGLIPLDMTALEWGVSHELVGLTATALLAHITAAEMIDRKFITPGPIVHSGTIIGSPVGQISAFAEQELCLDPARIDVDFDSGARFIEHVANLAMSSTLLSVLNQLSSHSLGLHCSFIELNTMTAQLLNTQNSAANAHLPTRMWFTGHHGHWAWGNDEQAVQTIIPKPKASSVSRNTVTVLS